MMLVSGYAGIGKSALVREVYKPITRQRGYFITGKFDQLHRNIPYAPLTQAFRSLIRQLLTESEAQIAAWREKLLAALGPNGQVIIDVVPEVALIIGPQPSVPVLPPARGAKSFEFGLPKLHSCVYSGRTSPCALPGRSAVGGCCFAESGSTC